MTLPLVLIVTHLIAEVILVVKVQRLAEREREGREREREGGERVRACVDVCGMRRDREIEVETEIISRIHKCSMTDLVLFFLLFVCLLFFSRCVKEKSKHFYPYIRALVNNKGLFDVS